MNITLYEFAVFIVHFFMVDNLKVPTLVSTATSSTSTSTRYLVSSTSMVKTAAQVLFAAATSDTGTAQ